MDRVAVGINTVGEGGVGAEGLDVADGAFVAGGDVVVLVDGGLVDEEDEEVSVAAVSVVVCPFSSSKVPSMLASLYKPLLEPALSVPWRSRLEPPTSAPSHSGSSTYCWTFFELTLPP